MRGISLSTLRLVLSDSLGRFWEDNLPVRRGLRTDRWRGTWQVLLAILCQRAHDGKLWRRGTSRGENTLEHDESCLTTTSDQIQCKCNFLRKNLQDAVRVLSRAYSRDRARPCLGFAKLRREEPRKTRKKADD